MLRTPLRALPARAAALVATLVVTLASLVWIGAPSATAADCEGPVTAVRGADPLCDSPNGRTFTLDVDEAEPGATIGFTGTGFVRDAGGGQTLSLKFNDIDIIGSGVEAADDGSVTGTVTLPSKEVFNQYAEQYGATRWWVRVLVGTGRTDGAEDLPAASVHDKFTVPAGALDGGGDTTDDTTDDGTDTTDGGTDDTTDDTDDTTGGTGGSGGATTTGGKGAAKLPDAGIEDHPGLVLGLGLAAVAGGLFWFERRLRRRPA